MNKAEQKSINGGDFACPPFGCYYADTTNSGPATHCGTCSDYRALPSSCQSRVMVDFECFGR
ncbi:hypothetical protein [Aquimarina addita]|uniref:hypothetical protein n=1 Tax=Aquimarina addita TaxID=870485 RepID=UPI0031EA6F6F